MFEVEVSGWFAAAHQLRHPDGTWEPLHGHNWMVRVTLRGPALDAFGVLADFTQVQPLLREILVEMHDRNLNDLASFAARNPSAENVAVHISERWRAQAGATADLLHCVAVEETPGCVARYFPGPLHG